MYPQCTHCGQDFLIEPGFYMGASYIGYAFTAIISVVTALAYVFLFPKVNEWLVISGIIITIGIFLPLISAIPAHSCSISWGASASIQASGARAYS